MSSSVAADSTTESTAAVGAPVIPVAAAPTVAADAPARVPDGTVTLAEVYEQLQSDARQAQALAARAGSKLHSCSYSLGYHTQPVYWCRTCHKDRQVGVCFGCSMNCHLEHEVEELFEKRAFRCDCGSGSAGGTCGMQPEKEDRNQLNQYNHNFKGEYCYCNGKYDPEKDIMYSCILCQDWFHDSHTDSHLQDHHDETADFFCRDCLANPKYRLLLPYLDLADEQAIASASGSAAGSAVNTPSVSRAVSLLRDEVAAAASPTPASPPPAAADATTTSAGEGTGAVVPASTSAETTPAVAEDASMQTPTRKRKADAIDGPNGSQAAPATATATSSPTAANGVDVSIVCRRPPAAVVVSNDDDSSSSAAALPIAPSKDRFVQGDWNLLLCPCPACVVEYSSCGLGWLLDEDLLPDGTRLTPDTNVLADMTDADAAAPIDAAFDANALGLSAVDRMPRGVAIDVIEPFRLFEESLKRQMADLHRTQPGIVVTDDMVRDITERAKRESTEAYREIKRARLNSDETAPE